MRACDAWAPTKRSSREIYKDQAARPNASIPRRNRGVVADGAARFAARQMRGAAVRAGAHPDAHGRAGAAVERLGHVGMLGVLSGAATHAGLESEAA